MNQLRLIATGTPPLFPVAKASAALERAWHRLCAARDAFADSPLGDTDELFARRDAWVDAIEEYERAREVLGREVKRARGERWLEVCR